MNDQTQWDAGKITTPLKAYFDQLDDKTLKILIPGSGNSYEAEYLHNNNFKNVFLVDISKIPLENFLNRCPSFPKSHLIHSDFFDLNMKFDLIIEQTFFCSLHPPTRSDYAKKSFELLNSGGKLVGVLFNDELYKDHPPYGGNKAEYVPHFKPYFDIKYFDICYNSIKPRAARELFINLVRKDIPGRQLKWPLQ